MRDLTLYEESIRKYSSSNLELELFHGYEEEIDEESYNTEKEHGYDCRCNMCREKKDDFRFYPEFEFDLLEENLELTNEIMEELALPLTCAGKETTSSCFTLHHVKCHKTEDFLGDDECRLKIFVDGKHKKMLKKNISDGQLWKVDLEVSFAQKVVVQLWDYDSPPLDPHDLIGKFKLRKELMAESKDFTTTKTLKSGRAHYNIKYSVKHSRLTTPFTPEPLPPLIDDPKYAYKSPKFKNSRKVNWDEFEKNRVNYAYPVAIDLVVKGKRVIDSIVNTQGSDAKEKKWNDSVAKRWFGEYSTVRLMRVRGFLNAALRRLTKKRLTFVRRSKHRKSPTANAATGWGSFRIAMYDPLFKYKDTTHYYCPGIGSATITSKFYIASVIVHEVMHQIRLTREDKYGREAENRAVINPRYAVNNAENYQLFTADAYINAVHSGRSLYWRKCWMERFIDMN